MDLVSLPSPLWVLGTDTGVGKTHTSSRIARAWATLGPVVYRKPFQTGVTDVDDPDADQGTVAGPGITVETGVVLRAPLSPLAAAEAEGRLLDLEALRAWTVRPVPARTRLLLEPAGGVMVPLGERVLFLDWAVPLGIPAVVVARGGLGTLNHTLLTCEALLSHGWSVEAVFLNAGLDGDQAPAEGNAALLRRFLPMPVNVLD